MTTEYYNTEMARLEAIIVEKRQNIANFESRPMESFPLLYHIAQARLYASVREQVRLTKEYNEST